MLSPRTFTRGWHLTYEGLERIFRERVDPWNFQTSPYEQARFAKMLDLVQAVPHARVLEAGCAEGHFTERLLTLSSAVTAIDLSTAAIERAQVRAPGADFCTIKLEELPIPSERYDVIVCAEMLYYVDDVPALIPKLRQMGTFLITSTIYPSALRVHAKLAGCNLLKNILHVSARELRATSIRLWKL